MSKRCRSFSPLQSIAAILLFLFIQFHFAFHFLHSPPSPEFCPLIQFLFAFIFLHSPPSPECSYFNYFIPKGFVPTDLPVIHFSFLLILLLSVARFTFFITSSR
ncbi:hypothetical protein ABFX02_11G091600 [Erythranthe guttata]